MDYLVTVRYVDSAEMFALSTDYNGSNGRAMARDVLEGWLRRTSEQAEIPPDDDYDLDPDSWTLTDFHLWGEGEMALAGFMPYRGEPVVFLFNVV